jgi:serine/threonine protein kinase
MVFAVSTDLSATGSGGGGGYKLCPRCHYIYPAGANFCGRDSAELQPDDRILAGKFILLRKIGEGNMGAVYEAEQPQIGRTVAVKVLRADPEVMLRFEREVHAAGSLNHPNVVTVFDSGVTEDGRGFIAMEYLEGASLAGLVESQGTLTPARAMELWIPAVRAMASAHGKGIVHRDLKPDNIFIAKQHGEEGEVSVVKVLDFGIAKFKKGRPQAKGTAPGIIIGTMQFMSPEQLQGAEADPRADVYALALILVEMMTGRLPWGQSKEQGYLQFALRMVTPPIPLEQLRPEQSFSPELRQIVADMLALDINSRPTDAGDVLRRLRQVPEAQAFLRKDASSEPISVSGAVSPPRIGEPAPRSGTMMVSRLSLLSKSGLRRPLPLIVAALLVLTLGGGLYTVLRGAWQKPVEKPTTAPVVDMAPAAVVLNVKPPKPDGSEAGPSLKPTHRPTHNSPSLLVQFAFTDAKGVRLSCGSKKLGTPECEPGGHGFCKLNATVSAGQRCIAEKDKQKRLITYSEMQKTRPDGKGVIHFFVRFP